ncbi:MAG: thiamine-phosphate pyrophosphorylase [Candidatus Omnitrophica bacterium]|nr:thiamine-phosphate pyrophosphorylase [Candidatus Omnitrophota bacterium]
MQKLNKIIRVIDANLNRAKEGLRVVEEIARFILEDRLLTESVKSIRHKIRTLSKNLIKTDLLLESRDSCGDIGKDIRADELKRKDIPDIFYANIQRVKESIRVLEEFSKIIDKNSSTGFKRMRYSLYEIEKKAVKRIAALSNSR